MAKEKVQEETLEIPTELLESNPLELAENEKGIQTIVAYLQATRENVRSAEASGKRISKGSATKTAPKKFDKNPLDMLISET
tara:strand:- start:47 stop:292 length:246 start_codon:yes stop_codon:yes gene_type:complete